MVGTRGGDAFEFSAEDDEQEALIRIGKQLLQLPKSKDAVFKLLKKAGEALEQTPQGSEGARLAVSDLSKALGRRELVKHKDKEVRLYTAFCLCHVLRIHAPDTPYTDDQLKDIFGLFNAVYAELEDPAGAHFQLCLSVLETVSQVKCSVLMLDLDADELVCDLFSTVLGAINEENQGMVESSALELLGSVLEESDDVSQPLLDTILSPLLPAKQQEGGGAPCRLAQLLLQRTEACVQPYLQKFLTNVLLGMRTDSELKDDVNALIFQLYQVVPQVLLPVLPHLSLELQVEAEPKRLAAADLLGRLFSHPGSGDILKEYAGLFNDLLKRLHDQKVDVRLKVVSFCKGLMDNCSDGGMRRQIIQGLLDRLMDMDDKVRSATVGTLCEILADRPNLAAAAMEPVLGRLRDKKVAVRREVAVQVGALLRSWCLKSHQNGPGAPKRSQVVGPLLVLLNLATRDAELASYIPDHVFKGGVFPKLPPEAQVQWWTFLWARAGDVGHSSVAKLLRSKYHLQQQVGHLAELRDAAKENRAAAGGGASSSLGVSGTASGTRAGASSVGAGAAKVADPEKALQTGMHKLAKLLHDVPKVEEGLQRLWEMKDNHIFRGLRTLATYGTTLEAASAAGKDVVQRVGSKGPAAEVARALVNRMSPSLLSPELLHATMEQAAESQEAQTLLVDVAAVSPQLFAQSLEPLVAMLEQDDPLLASCAARILAKAGRYLATAGRGTQGNKGWEKLVGKLEGPLVEMCGASSPAGAKAAVYALVTLLGPDRAAEVLWPAVEAALESMKRPATLRHHPKLLTAIKAVATVGRTLPQLFSEFADEFTDFVLDDLLKADLSKGKPLRQITEMTGEEWGRPTPGVDVKAAALKALAQSFVPDPQKGPPSKEAAEAAQVLLGRLQVLVNPDEESPEFEDFGLAGSIDGGWVRCAAASGMLRLARVHDHSLTGEAFVELALSLQDPLPDVRRRLTAKVVKAVEFFRTSPQRASKYAALLGLLAVDPVDGNQGAAFRALRDYVAFRRREVAASAQAAAAAGGGGGSMIQDMPEFVLPFLIFVLAHHPDYPGAEELAEWEGMDEGEREELEEAGQGHPLAAFQAMLQFVLEPLVFPPDAPTSPAEIALAIPATIKLLRMLKFCDDAVDRQYTDKAHQLCDIALALVKAMVDRATKGKAPKVGGFPGQVVLPRSCFEPPKNPRSEEKRPNGSHLPPHFAPQLTAEFFSQRFANMPLPGGKKAQARSKARSGGGGGRRSQQGHGEESQEEAAAGSQDGGDEVSSRRTEDEGSEPEEHDLPGSSSKRAKAGKRVAGAQQQRPSKPAGQRQPPGRGVGDAEGSSGEAAALKRKGAAPGSAQKKRKKAEPKQASPATRLQPRRGAKAVASTKLRADSSDDEEEEDEQQHAGPSKRPAAVAGGGDGDPMSQSDFENASMGSPAPGPSSAAAAVAAQRQRKRHQRPSSDTEWDDAGGGPQAMRLDGAAKGGGLAPKEKQPAGGRNAAAAGRGGTGAAGKGGKGVAQAAQPAAVLKPRSKNLRA